MKKSFRYHTIFTYGSLQSVGHTMDYFIKHTRKLVLFIIMPRVNNTGNLLRLYKKGLLLYERRVPSSRNVFWYYVLWWWYHYSFLFRYIRRSDKAIVFVSHPVACFGMSIVQKIFRVRYAYWIGDYYPPVRLSLALFEKVKKFYHDRIDMTYYLSDMINERINGRILTTTSRRTVMWGVNPPRGVKTIRRGDILGLLFVGVVRRSQGLEELFTYLSRHSDVRLHIVGVCEENLYNEYMHMIETLGISGRVIFPNSFVDDASLGELAKAHHVGVAMYEKGETSSTFYTDPGKVKTYVELGLPVIMTDTSAIAAYIRRFGAGEVIDDPALLPDAIESIKRKYAAYQRGILAFANHFAYERYYHQAFVALEKAR